MTVPLPPLRDMQGRLLYKGGGGVVTSRCQTKHIVANTDNQGNFFFGSDQDELA